MPITPTPRDRCRPVADAWRPGRFMPVVVVDFERPRTSRSSIATAASAAALSRRRRLANALFTHGAQLPDIALVAPPAVIGTNTVEAIQSGIMLGEADRVDGLVRRIFDQLGYPQRSSPRAVWRRSSSATRVPSTR
ncbi:MAG: type III pantothenate kinase [Eggerthella lenta]